MSEQGQNSEFVPQYQETLLVEELFPLLILTLRILAMAFCQDLEEKPSYGSKAHIKFLIISQFYLFLAMESAPL